MRSVLLMLLVQVLVIGAIVYAMWHVKPKEEEHGRTA
jgi:hypothetical protein